MLHQLCQTYNDEWTEDDNKIQCLIIATQDGEEHEEVNQECYKLYDDPASREINNSGMDYYDINNVEPDTNGEVVDEFLMNSIYEKLKIVARKRRDFLVDLINNFPNRSVLYTED